MKYSLALAFFLSAILAACGTDNPGRSGVPDVWTAIVPDSGVHDSGVHDSGMNDIGADEDVAAPPADAGSDTTGVPDVDEADGSAGVTDVATDTDTGSQTGSETGSVELPPPNGVAQFSNCSEPGGTFNIYDLQDPQCPDHPSPEPSSNPGVPMTLTGVTVTAVFTDTVFVQEANGGPYSGMAVFLHGIPPDDFAEGDIVDVDGSYGEYFGNTQLYLENYTVTGKGDVPQPFKVSHAAHVATGGEMAEMMEGVLIRVEDVATIHTKPDCPQDWKEFLVTGELRVDDMGVLWDARVGDQFASITGPLLWAFGNTKMEPRRAEDLDVTKPGGASSISKCIESECIVPETIMGTHEIIVSEIMADPFGADPGQEWIELYNPGNNPVDVSGWEVRDCGGQKLPLLGSHVIKAGGFLVLGSNKNPTTNGGVPVDYAYGDTFYLPNTVGSVILYDGSDAFAEVVDNTRYSAFEPWDTVFMTGSSIERKSAASDGTQVGSWKTGETVFGIGDNRGTPGEWNDAW